MGKLMIGLFAAMCSLGQAASGGEFFSRFYSGTEASGSLGGGDGSDSRGIKTVGGFAGVSWSDGALYGALEGEVGFGLGAAEDLGNDFEPHRSAGLGAIVGMHATQDLVLYGRAGVDYVQLRARRSDSTVSRNAAGLRLGLGADYALTHNFRIRGEIGRTFLENVDADVMERTEFRFGLITQF